jgi:hypothetical protein
MTRKPTYKGSKNVLDMIVASKEKEKNEIEEEHTKFDRHIVLINYVTSKISNIEIIKNYNIVRLIGFDKLTSKQDIDKYIKDNNILKSTKEQVELKIKSLIKDIESKINKNRLCLYNIMPPTRKLIGSSFEDDRYVK